MGLYMREIALDIDIYTKDKNIDNSDYQYLNNTIGKHTRRYRHGYQNINDAHGNENWKIIAHQGGLIYID